MFLLRLAATATSAAACACFCCLCSWCCFFLLLLLLLLLLGRRPSNPPSAMFDLQKYQEQFLQLIGTPLTSTHCDKICWYPTEIPREHAPPPPSPPPFGAPHQIFSWFAPRIRASLLLLLCEKHTLAAFDHPKCLYCFSCCLCCCFLSWLLCCFCFFCDVFAIFAA